MKTKEEIDGQAKIDGERIYPGMTANQQKQRDAFINGFCYGAEYSDQQNKELREKVKALDDHRIKIEEMELTERNRANKADAEIQRKHY